MRRPSRQGLSLVIVACAHLPLTGQNLELIGREKPFSVAGGLALNQIYNGSQGPVRREPFSIYASAHLTMSVYGWTIPLSFNLSNRQTSFSQPFHQYAINPSYRWITGHAGYCSMTFSPYTLNGHIFLGAGVDLVPQGNWKVSAMYGRFLKATPYDSLRFPAVLPTFKRMGYGAKISFGRNSNTANLIIFYAADEVDGMPHMLPGDPVTPEENLVLSFGMEKKVAEHITVNAEFAASALTRDSRSEKALHGHVLARAGLLKPTLSTSYFHAIKTSFDYKVQAARIGIGFERVDPQYRTLGAYYFNNDLQNITLNGSASMRQGRLNLTGSAGVQHDNLHKTKVSTMRRVVGSLHAHWTMSSRLNLSGFFSSFSTFTHIRPLFEEVNILTPFDRMDTLNFTQLSRSGNLSADWSVNAGGSKKFGIQLTFQDAADRHGTMSPFSGTRFYHMNTAYTITMASQTYVSVSFHATMNQGGAFANRIAGPGASLTRAFANRKIRLTTSSVYTKTYASGESLSSVLNARVNGVIVIREKHNLNLSAVISMRKRPADERRTGAREVTGTLGYAYTFGTTNNPDRTLQARRINK